MTVNVATAPVRKKYVAPTMELTSPSSSARHKTALELRKKLYNKFVRKSMDTVNNRVINTSAAHDCFKPAARRQSIGVVR